MRIIFLQLQTFITQKIMIYFFVFNHKEHKVHHKVPQTKKATHYRVAFYFIYSEINSRLIYYRGYKPLFANACI